MCNILLVEDDHELRPVLVGLLDEAGYSVIPCGTVAESENMFREHHIDLAIIDLKLPNGDGMDILRSVEGRIPHIAITDESDREIRNRAALYGAVAFLEKPFDEEELISIVDRVTKNKLGQYPPQRNEGKKISSREVGEDVDLQRVYAKIATVSSRVTGTREEVEELKVHIREADRTLRTQSGDLERMAMSMDALAERTQYCDERGKSIAVLEERVDVSRTNWARVIQFAIALIQAAATVYVVQAAHSLLR